MHIDRIFSNVFLFIDTLIEQTVEKDKYNPDNTDNF